MKRLALFLAVVVLTGCATTEQFSNNWYKPGTANENLKRDCYECQRDAMMLPQAPVNYPVTLAGAMEQAHKVDQRRLFNRCMESKGYINIIP